ncbi:MAG: hypothetical protein IJ830_04410 [Alphaproteobacteria bacterium]|nr:hypothetical protein [Alphaproteobacteria bacterium]
MKNNQSGRSMVEMLGVLAIIGVLSAGGLAGYSKAMFKHKLNSTMDQITMLVTNIRTMYGTQGNYANLENDAVDLGIIPAVMGSSINSLTNPFKGGVTIATIDARDNTAESGNTGFTLTYSGLPQEACIALATSDFGSGAGSGFIGVVANGGSNGTATEIGATGEGQAYEMNDAITDCENATGEDSKGDNSSITWYFY